MPKFTKQEIQFLKILEKEPINAQTWIRVPEMPFIGLDRGGYIKYFKFDEDNHFIQITEKGKNIVEFYRRVTNKP